MLKKLKYILLVCILLTTTVYADDDIPEEETNIVRLTEIPSMFQDYDKNNKYLIKDNEELPNGEDFVDDLISYDYDDRDLRRDYLIRACSRCVGSTDYERLNKMYEAYHKGFRFNNYENNSTGYARIGHNAREKEYFDVMSGIPSQEDMYIEAGGYSADFSFESILDETGDIPFYIVVNLTMGSNWIETADNPCTNIVSGTVGQHGQDGEKGTPGGGCVDTGGENHSCGDEGGGSGEKGSDSNGGSYTASSCLSDSGITENKMPEIKQDPTPPTGGETGADGVAGGETAFGPIGNCYDVTIEKAIGGAAGPEGSESGCGGAAGKGGNGGKSGTNELKVVEKHYINGYGTPINPMNINDYGNIIAPFNYNDSPYGTIRKSGITDLSGAGKNHAHASSQNVRMYTMCMPFVVNSTTFEKLMQFSGANLDNFDARVNTKFFTGKNGLNSSARDALPKYFRTQDQGDTQSVEIGYNIITYPNEASRFYAPIFQIYKEISEASKGYVGCREVDSRNFELDEYGNIIGEGNQDSPRICLEIDVGCTGDKDNWNPVPLWWDMGNAKEIRKDNNGGESKASKPEGLISGPNGKKYSETDDWRTLDSKTYLPMEMFDNWNSINDGNEYALYLNPDYVFASQEEYNKCRDKQAKLFMDRFFNALTQMMEDFETKLNENPALKMESWTHFDKHKDIESTNMILESDNITFFTPVKLFNQDWIAKQTFAGYRETAGDDSSNINHMFSDIMKQMLEWMKALPEDAYSNPVVMKALPYPMAGEPVERRRKVSLCVGDHLTNTSPADMVYELYDYPTDVTTMYTEENNPWETRKLARYNYAKFMYGYGDNEGNKTAAELASTFQRNPLWEVKRIPEKLSIAGSNDYTIPRIEYQRLTIDQYLNSNPFIQTKDCYCPVVVSGYNGKMCNDRIDNKQTFFDDDKREDIWRMPLNLNHALLARTLDAKQWYRYSYEDKAIYKVAMSIQSPTPTYNISKYNFEEANEAEFIEEMFERNVEEYDNNICKYEALLWYYATKPTGYIALETDYDLEKIKYLKLATDISALNYNTLDIEGDNDLDIVQKAILSSESSYLNEFKYSDYKIPHIHSNVTNLYRLADTTGAKILEPGTQPFIIYKPTNRKRQWSTASLNCNANVTSGVYSVGAVYLNYRRIWQFNKRNVIYNGTFDAFFGCTACYYMDIGGSHGSPVSEDTFYYRDNVTLCGTNNGKYIRCFYIDYLFSPTLPVYPRQTNIIANQEDIIDERLNMSDNQYDSDKEWLTDVTYYGRVIDTINGNDYVTYNMDTNVNDFKYAWLYNYVSKEGTTHYNNNFKDKRESGVNTEYKTSPPGFNSYANLNQIFIVNPVSLENVKVLGIPPTQDQRVPDTDLLCATKDPTHLYDKEERWHTETVKAKYDTYGNKISEGRNEVLPFVTIGKEFQILWSDKFSFDDKTFGDFKKTDGDVQDDYVSYLSDPIIDMQAFNMPYITGRLGPAWHAEDNGVPITKNKYYELNEFGEYDIIYKEDYLWNASDFPRCANYTRVNPDEKGKNYIKSRFIKFPFDCICINKDGNKQVFKEGQWYDINLLRQYRIDNTSYQELDNIPIMSYRDNNGNVIGFREITDPTKLTDDMFINGCDNINCVNTYYELHSGIQSDTPYDINENRLIMGVILLSTQEAASKSVEYYVEGTNARIDNTNHYNVEDYFDVDEWIDPLDLYIHKENIGNNRVVLRPGNCMDDSNYHIMKYSSWGTYSMQVPQSVLHNIGYGDVNICNLEKPAGIFLAYTDYNNVDTTWDGGNYNGDKYEFKYDFIRWLSKPQILVKKDFLDIVGSIGNITLDDTADPRYANNFRSLYDGEALETFDGDYLISGVIPEVDYSKGRDTFRSKYNIVNDLANSISNFLNTFGSQKIIGKDYKELELFTEEPIDNTVPLNNAFPLAASKNAIPGLRSTQLRPGYKFYFNIETIGNYLGINTTREDILNRLIVRPKYYYYCTEDNTWTPVDALYKDSNGTWKLANKYYYKQEDLEEAERAMIEAYPQYNFLISEILERSNETEKEKEIKTILRDDEVPGDIKQHNYMGKLFEDIIGGSQLIWLDEYNRDFIGAEERYGYDCLSDDIRHDTDFYSTNASDEDTHMTSQEFICHNQKWYCPIGLPSSVRFLPAYEGYDQITRPEWVTNIEQENIEFRSKEGIICMALDIGVRGDVWTLKYTDKEFNELNKWITDYSGTTTKNTHKYIYSQDSEGTNPQSYEIDTTVVDSPIFAVMDNKFCSSDDLSIAGTH